MDKLKAMANKLRVHSIRSTTLAGSGHPTSCMSCAEIMSVLFFNEIGSMDEFILSKGHAAPILYACYAEAGLIPVKELENLRKINSRLEGHPMPRLKGIKVASGSLGQGLCAGVGIAIGQKLLKQKGQVFVLQGDGETAEGSIWEACNSASHYNLDNLVLIVDVNRLGQSQPTMHGHDMKIYEKKFNAFGWNSMIVDGHDVNQLKIAFKKANLSKRPFVILAKTLKGKGSFVENKEGWHGKPFSTEEMKKVITRIGESNVELKSKYKIKNYSQKFKDYSFNKYELGDKIATRYAFGNALQKLAEKNPTFIGIDGDVQNSTKLNRLCKQYLKRCVESYIAEQNMVGMAIGLSSLGFTPFVATFAAFFTRAHDYIRMAAYSGSNIKFVGSHVGVSIGQDGPSQMGLEDLPMFLSIPGSVVMYPSDAVSTEACVKEMAKFEGISYLRTTRGKTPIIYGNNEKFKIGGLKVVKKSNKDVALVIGAGETLHEAIKAHADLLKKGINIRVIDLYSIKPLNEKALIKNAKEVNGKVIVVEDHYDYGIGSSVSGVLCNVKKLYVKEIPRSGKPEELRKMFGIDSAAIIKEVKKR